MAPPLCLWIDLARLSDSIRDDTARSELLGGAAGSISLPLCDATSPPCLVRNRSRLLDDYRLDTERAQTSRKRAEAGLYTAAPGRCATLCLGAELGQVAAPG
uniref:Uncharacterized protein n=1 Tax=Arundo donax TaxID=35708 RepID=A0A0A9GKU7_ARUDO